MSAPAALASLDIAEVTSPRCSAVATSEDFVGVPAIFVHGIFENLYRWLTPKEASAHGLSLADLAIAIPRFEFVVREDRPFQISMPMQERGLLDKLCNERMPALAFSYQDLVDPIASMQTAVEKLHRVAVASMERWKTERIQLVGHSRGGLVCRHAMLHDSAALSAAEFRRCVHRVTTIATPHRGSRVAEAINAIDNAIERFELFRDMVAAKVPKLTMAFSGHLWESLAKMRMIVATTAQLTPDSSEVSTANTLAMPRLPGGYFAVAGTTATYFRCDVPIVGSFRFPPSFPIAELTEGEGDIAVAVASALDIPDADERNTARFSVNHFNNAFKVQIHEAVLGWLRRAE